MEISQTSFLQSLVPIGTVVSEEKIKIRNANWDDGPTDIGHKVMTIALMILKAR